MKPIARALFALLIVSCAARDPAPPPDRVGAFESVAPEDAGFSEEKLAQVEAFCERSGSAALMVLHDGKSVLSWGAVETEYPVHSIRKALLNGLYGVYVERGVIDLEATLADLRIDDLPPRLSESEKQATLYDLIRSRSGVYHEAAAEAASMIASRPPRGSHAPGSHFYYNNWDFNALGTVFEQETGEQIFDAFFREFAVPLGMLHFTPEDGEYLFEEDRSLHPAYSFWMSAHDLALFGTLYARGGVWNGRRLISDQWIADSTAYQSIVDAETGLGYGWLWYVGAEEWGLGRVYLHTGAGIHMLAVLPDQDLVIVHRVDSERPTSEITFTTEDLYTLFEIIIDARVDED